MKGYSLLAKEFGDIENKQVFPRMTEVVLRRTFDIDEGNKIFNEHNMGLVIVDSNYAFHINELKVNKAFGLKVLLDTINIKSSEVVVIGDSETDIPMFDMCENSVTFESSKDKVKDMAKFVVNGEEGEGLINALDMIIRKKSLG
jgi:hydroxymethylpyrimidine pyrophosphatase-like HAD family hydrolase